MNHDKIAEELLAQTRTPQDAYDYAIRREKGIEHSRTMKTNPLGGQQVTPKQEPVNNINTRVRAYYCNNQNAQRGRGSRGRPFTRGHKTTEDNREMPIQVVKNSVTNAEINIIKIIYSPAPLKIKLVLNALNGAALLKFAVPHKLTIWKIQINRRN